MKPWGDASFFECPGVFVGILLLHDGEAWDGDVGEVLVIGPAASTGIVAFISHFR